jgi:hypothetical protein
VRRPPQRAAAAHSEITAGHNHGFLPERMV